MGINETTNSELEWRDDVIPVSLRFDDPYFSVVDGREETRHVFLKGNGLADRFGTCRAISIGELGFGTGLNFIECWRLWRTSRRPGAVLTYDAVEAYPISPGEITRALSAWPDLSEDIDQLVRVWTRAQNGPVEVDPQTVLRVHTSGVEQALTGFSSGINAWFLDGFSPAKNPDMWSQEVAELLARKSAQGATLASYTSAGWVRRNLQNAGFSIERVPGFGRKRHMITGRLDGAK